MWPHDHKHPFVIRLINNHRSNDYSVSIIIIHEELVSYYDAELVVWRELLREEDKNKKEE